MSTFKLSLIGALLAAPALGGNPGESPAPVAGVKLEVVKYRELCQAVRALSGKIVVVDVWAEF